MYKNQLLYLSVSLLASSIVVADHMQQSKRILSTQEPTQSTQSQSEAKTETEASKQFAGGLKPVPFKEAKNSQAHEQALRKQQETLMVKLNQLRRERDNLLMSMRGKKGLSDTDSHQITKYDEAINQVMRNIEQVNKALIKTV